MSDPISPQSVDDVTIAATCTVSGRVPVNIPSRLLQYFSVINMPTPTLSTTQHILQAKLGRYYIINRSNTVINEYVRQNTYKVSKLISNYVSQLVTARTHSQSIR